MANKKLSRDIPNWFDLRNYDIARTFGAFEWACNLDIRSYILKAKPEDKYVDEFRELIKKHGAIPKELCDEYVRGELEMFEGQGWTGELVYSMPVRRAYEIYDWIKWDTVLQFNLAVIDYQHIQQDSRSWPLDEFEEEISKWHRDVFLRGNYDDFYDEYGEYSPHVCVDLEAPDDVLVEAFKTWLSAKRQTDAERTLKSNAGRKKGRWNFVKWCEYGVLPYLDLKMHQAETNTKLTLHAIGDAIFDLSVEFDTTEAVRKTTVMYADEALLAKNPLESHGYYERNRKKEKT